MLHFLIHILCSPHYCDKLLELKQLDDQRFNLLCRLNIVTEEKNMYEALVKKHKENLKTLLESYKEQMKKETYIKFYEARMNDHNVGYIPLTFHFDRMKEFCQTKENIKKNMVKLKTIEKEFTRLQKRYEAINAKIEDIDKKALRITQDQDK